MHEANSSETETCYHSSNTELSWEVVDVMRQPTNVILDLGCTRAMGSRRAIMRLVKACQGTHLKTEMLPSRCSFNFANSQTAVSKENCRIQFGSQAALYTDFDIDEEGNVPLLMSLP